MGKKLCPKVILEGTRLTFKTEIAFALNELPRIVGPKKYRYHSLVISSEWCGFTNFPWGRGPINFDPTTEEARAMEVYRTWARLIELQRYYSWIVDRFHISTEIYQRHAHGKEYDFSWLETRLHNPGFHLVVCYRTPDSFEAARRERLKVSGKPSQYDDLQAFIDEQDEYLEEGRKSLLPCLELDVSDNSIANAAGRIADWLEETGGLYAKDA